MGKLPPKDYVFLWNQGTPENRSTDFCLVKKEIDVACDPNNRYSMSGLGAYISEYSPEHKKPLQIKAQLMIDYAHHVYYDFLEPQLLYETFMQLEYFSDCDAYYGQSLHNIENTRVLQDYYDRCAAFDWYYAMSDDSRIYNAGQRAGQLLANEGLRDPDKVLIWKGWKEHKYSGKPWNTEQIPAPVRPE